MTHIEDGVYDIIQTKSNNLFLLLHKYIHMNILMP